MLFVGVDLTSAFPREPRANDVAVLGPDLDCRFAQAAWPGPDVVTGRDPVALRRMLSAAIGADAGEQVWAVDGPQGLASIGQSMRHAERVLGTAGKTPDRLPPAQSGGRPFEDYIRSGVDLFAALLASLPPWRLAGVDGVALDATLLEVYPGAEWTVLAGRKMPHKTTKAGRASRRDLMAALGVRGLPDLPTPDENDAIVAAYLAWCTRHAPSSVALRGLPPHHDHGELREGYILHLEGAPSHLTTLPELVTSGDRAQPTSVENVREVEGDWCANEALVVKLTDYGIVHGTCPENNWLEGGRDYTCETLAPAPTLRFELVHAPTFSGGRGWRVEPKVKTLLTQLGYSTPPSLGATNAVTLRIRVV